MVDDVDAVVGFVVSGLDAINTTLPTPPDEQVREHFVRHHQIDVSAFPDCTSSFLSYLIWLLSPGIYRDLHG